MGKFMKRIAFLAGFYFISGVSAADDNQDEFRYLEYEGVKVKTTFRIDQKFIGKYSGKKTGYLILNEDGSGIYSHDYHGFRKNDCHDGEIEMQWGFLIDENGEVVRFERPYGYSYPVIYYSTGEGGFQDCTKSALVDYILEYEDGTITISSSDDWVKN
jgi:hypothetical protein